MSTAPSATMVSSTRRPIPLRGRIDLVVRRIEYKGVGSWVIKDPVGLKYHRLQAEQYHVLQLLNGRRTLEEIREDLLARFPTLNFTLADVQFLITDLHRKGLVYSDRPGQGVSLIKQHRKQRKEKFFRTIRNLLYLRLPGWDPETTLQRIYPLFRWVFHPWAVALAMLLVVSSMVLLTVQFDEFRRRLPEFQQFFGWPNLIYLWLTLSLTKIVHEFGHGLSCKHFGGECHEMGLIFLVFSPCLYCDVSDSWMLRNKWQRIIIGGAGIYIEIILSAIAIFVWWNTSPGMLHHLSLNVFFVTAVTTVIFNANPLMRFDGYYMLADFLEIPNLRPKSDKLLRETFAWYCLGIESRPDPFMPETGRFWFVTFAIAAALYRWFILFGITLFLYTVLKPYDLQSIGATLAVVSVGSIVGNIFYNIYRIISAPRIEPLNYFKIALTLSVVAGLTAAALTMPLPLHIESAFLLEPQNVKHVHTITPGRLVELYVEPGQRVETGDVLAKLESVQMLEKRHALGVELEVQERRVRVFRALADIAQLEIALEGRESVRKQLADYEQQLSHLTIVAPMAGVVVAPPRVPEPETDRTQKMLHRWHGTPLERRNMGCFLESRTHLLSIAPNDRLEAVLFVDQADRDDMADEQPVEIKFEHLPDRTYAATVSAFSPQPKQFVPESLSNKTGGVLATVTDHSGRERLPSPAYQATVLIDQETELLRPGMRGQARFQVAHRSAWQWLWRYLRENFYFRL